MWCSSDEHFFRIVQVPAKGDGRWPIHRKPGAADVAPRPDPHLRPKDVYSSGVWWKILLHDVWCWPWQKRVSLSFGFAGGLDPAWCTRVLADPLWRIRIHWICHMYLEAGTLILSIWVQHAVTLEHSKKNCQVSQRLPQTAGVVVTLTTQHPNALVDIMWQLL